MAEELTMPHGYREAEHTAIDEHTFLMERPIVTDVPRHGERDGVGVRD